MNKAQCTSLFHSYNQEMWHGLSTCGDSCFRSHRFLCILRPPNRNQMCTTTVNWWPLTFCKYFSVHETDLLLGWVLGVVHNCKKLFLKPYRYVIFNILGAFGVVHKGEMIASDGTVKAVAIKTIKCKFC